MFTRVLSLGLLCCTLASGAQAAVLFSTNSTWRLFRGTNEASLPDTSAWRSHGFGDSNFTDAPAPFWYGDARPGGTQLTDMLNVYTCIFLRKSISVDNPGEISGLRLTYFIDDGFVAWINGQEIFREGVTNSVLGTNTLAINQPLDPAPLVTTNIAVAPGVLQSGANTLAVQVFNTSAGSSDLGFDLELRTIVAETVPPTIVNVSPPPGNVTTLNEVTVTFSEPVLNVNADDLLINTQPASAVSGSGATYTFAFDQPIFGAVAFSWFPTHGITDEAVPPNAFDANGPGATWLYNLVDNVPPTVSTLFPAAGVTVRGLSSVEVTFSEEVTGVNAADLLINNQPATNVTRIPAGPYIFQFPTPTPGTVQVRWANTHGIADQASSPNPFAGGSWTYVYDPNASPGDLVINEFLASNQSGLLDEDGQEEDWIEIYNRGTNAVELRDWSLSDDPELPGFWTFGPGQIAPGEYLVVFASGKDRRTPTGTNRFHTNFQLGSGGGFLGLFTSDSPRVLASGFTDYPLQRNDNSYGYDPQGNPRYFNPPTPGGPNGTSTIAGITEPVHFSTLRGHFTQPFNLTLTCPTPGASIRYTTDGQEPTLLNSRPYFAQLRITNTALIRATAFRTNFLPSKPITHTYFFNLPAIQRSIPAISIVTATSNLVGRTGILGMNGGSRASDGLFITNNPATDYHNPSGHGIAWERPVSAEYIRPQDNSGFQIDCGIRVQGSDWQRPRTTSTSKFSYRLYFRGDYGEGRLEEALFPLASSQSFDQLVLRAGFNDNNNPFVRDELTRRLSHDMGQVASHGGFAVLYTNGIYAGYYNPTERVHDSFMQSYLGGGSEWDVVAPDFATSSEGLGIVDGDRNDFRNLLTNVWNGTLLPVTNQAKYVAISQRLNLTNFTDYCLLNAYAAMGDWPANNWRAGRERVPGALWHFVIWDGEWANGFDTKTVAYDTFAQTGTGTLDAGLNSTVNSEIARLYQGLRANPEFRLLWADRIHKHFFNGGALTSLNVSNRLQQMRTELQSLINMTDTEFLNWHKDRPPQMILQFNLYGLYGYSNALYGVYASSNAPAYNQHGGVVPPGFNLTMSAPLGGTIYYTLNGGDPRVPFTGAVSDGAAAFTTPIVINQSTVVRSRTLLNGTNWSALAEAEFKVATLGPTLRVTEIHYNPTNQAHEFIEIQNYGSTPVDLSGMIFEGITYTFVNGASLAAGARLVLASDLLPQEFAFRYPGVTVFGYFGGALNNGGERIALRAPDGSLVFSLDYDDAGGWPTAADGSGPSLEINDPAGDPDDPANWHTGALAGGTPGAPNSAQQPPFVHLNEIMAENGGIVNHAGTFPDFVEIYNPNGAPANLAGWSLSDDGNPRKFIFPGGTTIPAQGYLVVWCDDTTNTTPGLHAGFSLSRTGDSVFLYDQVTNRVDALTFGLQLTNYSVGRLGTWQLTTPTPGGANAAATLAPASSLVINEWLANAAPGQSDWIELHNTASLPVGLRGLFLSNTSAVHQIRSLSFVAPLGFAQLFADEGVGADRLDFKLSAGGGSIVLYDSLAAEINRVSYSNALENVTSGRLPDAAANVVGFPGSASPGASNYVNTYSGPVLNEVLARNQSAVTNAGNAADYVELFNPTGAQFDLGGMSLSVGSAQPGQFIFTPGTQVPAGGYLVVWCDGARPPSTAGSLNTGRALDGESGGVYLFNAAGQLINVVEYGFQVPDRPIGLAAGQWRLLSAASPGAANASPQTLGTNLVLKINEWMANPASGDDWFELYNPTNLPIDLNTVALTDDPSLAGLGKHRGAPLSFIAPNGFVRWIADGNPDNGRDHVSFNLDAEAELLRISSIVGTNYVAIDAVTFESQALGVSEGRLPDGQNGLVRFVGSPTPAESNYRLLPTMVINEILTHADPPLEDALELRNTGPTPLSLGGWFLSDNQADFKKYRIPDGTSIAAGGFLVFYQNQFSNGTPASFTFDSAHGDEAWLSEADAAGNLTGYRTGAKFGAAINGVSFGRITTSAGVDYAALTNRTFGQDNPSTLAQFRTGAGLPNAVPLVGPVILSEVMYHPPDNGLITGDDEYIELQNVTAAPVQLSHPAQPANTWHLAGGVEFTFPTSVTLPANGFILVVPFNPADLSALSAFRTKYGVASSVPVYGPYTGRLDNGGESIELLKPDVPQPAGAPDAGFVPYVLADKVNYNDRPPWPSGAVDGGGLSLQRRGPGLYGNEPLNWTSATPTPGAVNGTSPVPAPVITQSPQSQSVLEGATPQLSVAASGTGPLGYQWRFNGTSIPDATNSSLSFSFAIAENEGDYDCVVNNTGGSAVSALARLGVMVPVSVLIPPTSGIVTQANTASFTVAARGSAPVRYQWRLNGFNLANETNATLVRTNAQLPDDGVYDVVISNPVSTAIASATLVVYIRPAYVIPPANVVVADGADFAVSAVISGNPAPFAYSWRRSSTVINTNSGNYRSNFVVINAKTAGFVLTNNIPSSNFLGRLVIYNPAFTSPGVLANFTVTVLADSDADGIPDEWELSNGFNPGNPADRIGDSDHDGSSNYDEYVAGTDPTNALSYLKLDLTSVGNGATLQFGAISNRTYSVLYSETLAPNAWFKLVDVVAKTNNRVEPIFDPAWSTNRFYRVVTPFR